MHFVEDWSKSGIRHLTEKLIRVSVDNFIAGALVGRTRRGTIIVKAAPILRKFEGGGLISLLHWCNQKGFKVFLYGENGLLKRVV